jgi:hypothetical protein
MILKKLEDIENTSNGPIVIVKNEKMNLRYDFIFKIKQNSKIINIENIVCYKLISALRVKLSNQILNRFKNQKNKLQPKIDKNI